MRFKGLLGAAAVSAAAAVLLSPVRAVAETKHERELEGRVLALEQCMIALEQRIDGGALSQSETLCKKLGMAGQAQNEAGSRAPQHRQVGQAKAGPGPDGQAHNQSDTQGRFMAQDQTGAQSGGGAPADSSQAQAGAPADASQQAPGGQQPSGQQNSGAPGSGAAAQQTTDESKPQELQTFRENAVTVKAHQVEMETDVGYQRNQTSFQNDRALLGGTLIRYGAFNWLEIAGQLPYGYTTRQSQTGPTQSVFYSVKGIGDANVQANAQVLNQTPSMPGGVLSVGLVFPTGRSPYNFSNYGFNRADSAAIPNPSDPFRDVFSLGTWAVRGNFQMYKTVDPIIFFWGVGAEYPFAKEISGFTVQPGMIYTYNFGTSMAVSEKTTLGLTFSGAYWNAIRVDGYRVPGSTEEPIVGTLNLIQRVADSWYIEPSVGVGLTNDAPNFAGNLGVMHRF